LRTATAQQAASAFCEQLGELVADIRRGSFLVAAWLLTTPLV
jgi:hypothetical protein